MDPTTERGIEYLPLDALTPASVNSKEHDLDGIVASIKEFGFTIPVLLDERTDRSIVAGHGRREALQTMHAKLDDPPDGIRVVDGVWHVPVTTGWASRDDDHAKAMLIADNKLTEKGGWDDRVLAEQLEELLDTAPDLFALTGFDQADLDQLIDDASADTASTGSTNTDADELPEPEAVPAVCQRGDVWALGRHRLVCGDASDEKVHAKVRGSLDVQAIIADPPYGMRLDTDWSTIKGHLKSGGSVSTTGNKYDHVIGDHEDFDPVPVLSMYQSVTEQFWFGADYYAERIPARNDGSWLVWDKRKESQADGIGSEFELCWSRVKHKRRLLRHEWFGFLTSTENSADARNRVHPTQKPMTLIVDILTQWVAANAVVLDPYAGSGTTLVACESLGMTALLIELDPHYCDVILTRYADLTETMPVRESDGNTWKPKSK